MSIYKREDRVTKDDQAAEMQEVYLQIGLANKKPAGPPATGKCLNCGEEVDPHMRWCDVDCREDWEKRNAMGYTQCLPTEL